MRSAMSDRFGLSGNGILDRLDRVAFEFCKGVLVGLIAGLAVGLGARIAMRIVALAAGIQPEFTMEGTLFILMSTAVMGAPLGPVFLAVRRWLPGSGRSKALSFGVLVLIFLGIPFLLGGATDPAQRAPGGPASGRSAAVRGAFPGLRGHIGGGREIPGDPQRVTLPVAVRRRLTGNMSGRWVLQPKQTEQWERPQGLVLTAVLRPTSRYHGGKLAAGNSHDAQ